MGYETKDGIKVTVGGQPFQATKEVAYWQCGNCGHLEPQTDFLGELNFRPLTRLASKISCPNCGSYTIQKAYDESFTRGEFLVVRTKNKIRGKRKHG